MFMQFRLTLVFVAAIAVAGCKAIGPGSLQRDRLDYGSAISGSWREQTLLNIVKLRYFDAPEYLEVSSVISSYSLSTEVNIEGQWYSFSTSTGVNNTNRRLGATGIYIDRPTITYAPVTGKKYVDKLLRPIPPEEIFAMIRAGHPADYILSLTVQAINDVYNYSATPARARREDPTFQQVIEAIRRIQRAGALGIRIDKRGKEESTLIFFRGRGNPDVDTDIRFVKDTLGIKSENNEMPLTFGSERRSDNEITLLTRTMWEVLAELSAGVEVPEQDTAEGRATARPPLSNRPHTTPIAHIHSGSDRPTSAYAAVRYRDHWFWIDDRDLASKRVLTFLMVFSSIAETGAAPPVPVVTIPAR